MRTHSNIHTQFKVVVPASIMVIALCTFFSGRAEAHEDQGNDGSGGTAKTILAFDLDFVASLREPGADIGGGGALRLGRKLDVILLSLTPEIGGDYHYFNGDNNTRTYRGFIGARLGLGKIIEPSVFAHVGVGRLDANLGGHTSPTFDAGFALDLTFLPLINLGAHASYNALLPQGDYVSFNWLVLGLHAALVF